MKGKIIYAASNGKVGLAYVSEDRKYAEQGIDTNWPYLVELTVTRVFKAAPIFTEVE